MTPELLAFLREYGLPLTMLGLFAWAMYKRWFVTKGELDDKQAELEKMTALFEREREDRIAAQKVSAEVASASANVAESIERAISRDIYDERQTGRVSRGRV